MRSVIQTSEQAGVRSHHVIVADGGTDPRLPESIVSQILVGAPEHCTAEVAILPAHTGAGGAVCRFFGSLLAKGQYVCYLDDDNCFRRDHFARCVSILESNRDLDWLHTGQMVVLENHQESLESAEGIPDLCENLGMLRSAYYMPFENVTDTNCFFLRKFTCDVVSKAWATDLGRGHRTLSDRVVYWTLLDKFPTHAFLFEPTVYYVAKPEHYKVFKRGNQKVGRRVRCHLGKTILFSPSKFRTGFLKSMRALRALAIRHTLRRGMRWDA